MKLGPVTKLDKRNTGTSKKFDDDVMLTNYDVIVFFSIYGQFTAIRQLDSGCMVHKTYIFINFHVTLGYIFFFYQGFLSQTLTTHRRAGEGRGPFSITLYHFHPLTNIQTFTCNFAREMTITYF